MLTSKLPITLCTSSFFTTNRTTTKIKAPPMPSLAQNLLNPFGQNTLLFTLSQKRCVPCDNITNVTKICWYSHFLISWFIAMKQYDIVAKPKSWKLLGTERTLSGTGTVRWPEFSWTSISGGSADQNQIPSCSARVGRSSKTLNHPSRKLQRSQRSLSSLEWHCED